MHTEFTDKATQELDAENTTAHELSFVEAVKQGLNDAKNGNTLSLEEVKNAMLEQNLKQQRAHEWKAENTAAIEAYNEFISENGLFGDEYWKL